MVEKLFGEVVSLEQPSKIQDSEVATLPALREVVFNSIRQIKTDFVIHVQHSI